MSNDKEHEKALKDIGYWGKKGAGAFVFSRDTNRFLIGLRSLFVEQPSTWGTFGGAIDHGETSLKTALRETHEETQINLQDIEDCILIYTYEDTSTGFTYDNYIIIVQREFVPILNWENDDARWLLPNQFPSNLHFGARALMNSIGFKKFLLSLG